jgi:DNA-binding transcriptional MerR regulator
MNSQPALGQKAIGTTQESVPDNSLGAIKGPITGRDVQAPKSEVDERSDKKAPGAFRTISEVSEELDVQQHVLRFWETKFSQIRPLKRGGGRRYYRPEDLVLLKKIYHLLYTEGYTIKGVQKLLKEKGRAFLLEETAPPPQNSNQPTAAAPAIQATQPAAQTQGVAISAAQKSVLQSMLGELKEIRKLVKPD